MDEITQYIDRAPLKIQPKLQALRLLILDTVPMVKEVISYQMPTYVYYKNLIHFAYHKHHIGIYPGPSGVTYALFIDPTLTHSKGALVFDFDNELPIDLIRSILLYLIKEYDIQYGMKLPMKKKTIG